MTLSESGAGRTSSPSASSAPASGPEQQHPQSRAEEQEHQQQQQPQAQPAPLRCAGCTLPIADPELLAIDEQHWHEQCARCALCGVRLERSCFRLRNRLLCRADFLRYVVHLFVPVCEQFWVAFTFLISELC